MDVRPNHTVYINNLNEKVKKEGESKFHVTQTTGNLGGGSKIKVYRVYSEK